MLICKPEAMGLLGEGKVGRSLCGILGLKNAKTQFPKIDNM